MSTKIAINGFGRIGRLVYRSLLESNFLNNSVEVVAVNDLVSAENLAYLLKFDSVHGTMKEDVKAIGEDILSVDGREFKALSMKVNPSELPWQELEVDLVIECTGLFTKRNDAQGHISAGAKKVIISAPGDESINTYLVGVNDDKYQGEDIISNASCTTNCLAPLVHVLMKSGIGLDEGLMTTNHAYTASQALIDGTSRKDFRAGRAAAVNIIPSSTGAAKAIGRIIPEVEGKLTGMSFRVPVVNVSVVDLTFKPSRDTSLKEINKVMKEASETYLEGILQYTEDPVVSTDFMQSSYSSTYDATASIELNPRFFKLIAWYDNEWGYSQRIVDLLNKVIHK
jgi:glyceraldehyde 3-phosphate dehydrogenase